MYPCINGQWGRNVQARFAGDRHNITCPVQTKRLTHRASGEYGVAYEAAVVTIPNVIGVAIARPPAYWT